jgi:hypothetical protein
MEINSLSKQHDTDTRKGYGRRLEFIEYRLFWEGGVNRADLKVKFGVSTPQASKDLAQYKTLAPRNIHYDSSAKCYVPTPSFSPIFLKPNPAHFLLELKTSADHVLSPDEMWLGSSPPVASSPVPGRHIDPNILRTLLDAIRRRRSINALYHSIASKRPAPIWQWITPHALASDGLRWHARGYCHEEGRFRDFLLSRFIDTGKQGPAGALSSSDKDWNTYFTVVLVPNPRLSDIKKNMVAHEYGMAHSQLVISVRNALLYYFNKRLRLDVHAMDEPHEAPIVVKNSAEMKATIEASKGALAV